MATTPGSTLHWSFHHRGRGGSNSTELLLGPGDGRLRSITVARTGDGWTRYSGTYEVPAGRRLTRIAFRTLDPGSVGNFLDAVELTLER